jgi:hypothetical protein
MPPTPRLERIHIRTPIIPAIKMMKVSLSPPKASI